MRPAARTGPRWCCAWVSRSIWQPRSREQEAFGLLVSALQRPSARADPALFAAALVTAAAVACLIDVATARHLGEQAVQVARQLGDERLLSRALGSLCAAHSFAGESETGRQFGQESVERARSLGDDVLLAEGLLEYLMVTDPDRSGLLYADAFACTERSGDHVINASLHNNTGVAALRAGDLPAARAHLEAAAQAAQQIGWEDATGQANLGLVLRAEGNPDGARSTVEAALRISRRNGDNWRSRRIPVPRSRKSASRPTLSARLTFGLAKAGPWQTARARGRGGKA
jgi:tetratricopeptide (TPR) repeat protein